MPVHASARLAAVAVLLGAALACTSARVRATLRDEPVCPDFEVGAAHATFKGALRRPVQVTVLKGKTVLSERIALGKRTAADPPGVLVVQDTDEKLTVRFAQCGNEFAPHPVGAAERDPKHKEDLTSYNCGYPKVYREITVAIRRGDPLSRVIPWQPPPEPECLTNVVPPAAASATPARSP